MSPSAKKRVQNSVVFKMQDEKPHDKIKQPISKLTERNRLRMVLKNLSLLRLLKNSNPRIQEMYSLARRCWNSLLNVPKVLLTSSRNNTKMGRNNEGLREAKRSKKKLESKNLGKPKKLKSKVRVPETKKVQQSRAAVPEEEQHVQPEVPKPARGHGLITCPEAWGRQLPTGDPGIIFPKTHQGDKEQQEAADQRNWFEGLPRRIHLPGPRVMCRPSTMRLVKRCCTRFCSASLELPMCHPYRV